MMYFIMLCISFQLVYEAAEDGTIDTRLAILIIVLDINDNPPVFSKEEYTATLNESQTQGKTYCIKHGISNNI